MRKGWGRPCERPQRSQLEIESLGAGQRHDIEQRPSISVPHYRRRAGVLDVAIQGLNASRKKSAVFCWAANAGSGFAAGAAATLRYRTAPDTRWFLVPRA